MALTGLESLHLVFALGDVLADSDALVVPLFKAQRRMKITSVLFAADTTATAADTNYQAVAVKNGATTLATATTGPAAGGDTLTAGAFTTKSVAAASQQVNSGSTITVDYTKTGTGMALSGLTIQIVGEILPE